MRVLRMIRLMVLFAPVAALIGCSDGGTNQLQSLDAFSGGFSAEGQRCSAAGVTIANVSSHAYAKASVQEKILVANDLDHSRKVALKQLATTALTAVPRQLVQLFLVNGDIRITPDATKICSAKTDEAQTRGVAGCFVALTENNRQRLSIIADATEAAVGGTIVRSFGYWVSQNLASLGEADGLTYLASTPNKSFVANQRKVAREYFEDVSARRLFDLSHFDSLLGKGGAAKVSENINDGKADPLSGVTFNVKADGAKRAERRARFESYIFAEAFDSFFCNTHAAHPSNPNYRASDLQATLASLKNTNKVFRDLFPGTYQEFVGVIAGVLQEVTAFLEAKSHQDNEAALWLAADGLSDTQETPAPQSVAISEPTGQSSAPPTAATPTAVPPATPATTPPATTPVVTGEPPTAKPGAVTVIIDAQGQAIDEGNIQVIQPNGGMDQDLNIEIINQNPGPQNPGEVDVQVGGLQPGNPNGPGLDTSIVTPAVTSQPPVQQPQTTQPPVQQPQTAQPPVQQPQTTQPPVQEPQTTQPPVHQPPVQQPVGPQTPQFPAHTGQISHVSYPQIQSWPGYYGGGGHGGGGYGGYGGCGG